MVSSKQQATVHCKTETATGKEQHRFDHDKFQSKLAFYSGVQVYGRCRNI